MEVKGRILGLLILGGCASGVSYNWPETNPFEAYKASTLEDYPSTHLTKIDLLFTANIFGETDPCGCASGPKGGLDRRLNYLRMTPSFGDRVIVDAGNGLFSTDKLDPNRIDFLKKRAAAVLQGAQGMGYQAINIGYLDLGAGADFLKSLGKKYKTPFVSASLVSKDEDNRWFKAFVDLQISTKTIRVTGLTSGRKDLDSSLSLVDSSLALKRVVSEGASPDLLVILSDLGRLEDEAILKQNLGVPVVVIGSRDLSSLDRPIVRGPQLLVQPQFRGQQWGRLRLLTHNKGNSWFNVGQAPDFYLRWDEIRGKYNEYSKRQSGSERSGEIKNQIAAAEEILGQGPPEKGELGQAFDYELIDLGARYMKTNELSKVMKEVAED